MELVDCPRCGREHVVDRLATSPGWTDGMRGGVAPLAARCAGCARPFVLGELRAPGPLVWDLAEPCDVWLVSIGPALAPVINVLRRHLAIDLAAARELTTRLHRKVAAAIPAEAAAALRGELLAAGATADTCLADARDRADLARDWARAPRARALDAATLHALAGEVEPRLELIVRVHAWWADNDPVRRGVPAQLDAANLERIVALLAVPYAGHAAWRAEALRALGRFGEAIAVADEVPAGDERPVAVQIAALARLGDRTVHPLAPPPPPAAIADGAATPDAVLAFLRALLPAPLAIHARAGERLVETETVAVVIGEADVAIYQPGWRWTGPHTARRDHRPVAHFAWAELDTAWDTQLADALRDAIAHRRATYIVCRYCHVPTPPEHGGEVCQACSERHRGVVH